MFGVCKGSGVWSQPEAWEADLGLSLRKRREDTLGPVRSLAYSTWLCRRGKGLISSLCTVHKAVLSAVG